MQELLPILSRLCSHGRRGLGITLLHGGGSYRSTRCVGIRDTYAPLCLAATAADVNAGHKGEGAVP